MSFLRHKKLDSLPRWQTPLSLGVAYTIIFVCSLILANLLRFDFVVPPHFAERIAPNLCFLVPAKLLLLSLTGQLTALLPFFRLPDLYRVATGMAMVGGLFWLGWAFFPDFLPPRSVIVGDALLSFLGVSALRTACRVWFERQARSLTSDFVVSRKDLKLQTSDF